MFLKKLVILHSRRKEMKIILREEEGLIHSICGIIYNRDDPVGCLLGSTTSPAGSNLK